MAFYLQQSAGSSDVLSSKENRLGENRKLGNWIELIELLGGKAR